MFVLLVLNDSWFIGLTSQVVFMLWPSGSFHCSSWKTTSWLKVPSCSYSCQYLCVQSYSVVLQMICSDKLPHNSLKSTESFVEYKRLILNSWCDLQQFSRQFSCILCEYMHAFEIYLCWHNKYYWSVEMSRGFPSCLLQLNFTFSEWAFGGCLFMINMVGPCS